LVDHSGQQLDEGGLVVGGQVAHTPNMKRKSWESESGPATLGTTARSHLVLRVWCTDCLHRADLDPGEQAERHGPDLPVRDSAQPAHLLAMRQPSGSFRRRAAVYRRGRGSIKIPG
jgi:hypothetical protein